MLVTYSNSQIDFAEFVEFFSPFSAAPLRHENVPALGLRLFRRTFTNEFVAGACKTSSEPEVNQHRVTSPSPIFSTQFQQR